MRNRIDNRLLTFRIFEQDCVIGFVKVLRQWDFGTLQIYNKRAFRQS